MVFIPGQGTLLFGTGGIIEPATAAASQTNRRGAEEDTYPPPKNQGDHMRGDAPAVKRARKASLPDALTAAASQASRDDALDDLEYDKVANSSRAARQSTWLTWGRMHQSWFGTTVPVLPLSVSKIRAVAAMFKAGH